jgi:hypothetical protein
MSVTPDDWLLAFLGSRPVALVDGDRLWLHGRSGSMLALVRVP